ncbi:MAG: helix-turn-helix transcriptional regulator [Alphaproteobacteria bacterium]|nr:helix-turn-helix transcriptional regulator [Alphaproteobacteria bacterium]
MLKHADIWQAIDRLAASHGFSASGLARRAGLDPTTFNKSKRVARDGRPRWPSTESIAKILEATGASLAEFVGHLGAVPGKAGSRRIPVTSLAPSGVTATFDAAGHPSGTGWDELPFGDLPDAHAYALEVYGDAMLPIHRDGDTIVVSPAADLRRGDRVVVRTTAGEVLVRQLIRKGARKVELAALNPPQPDLTLAIEDVAFIHRIVWASQ